MHTERTAEGIYFLKNESFQNVSFSVLSQYHRKIEAVQADQKHTKREKAKLTFLHAQKSKDQKRQIIDKHDLTMHMEKTSRSQK